MKKLWIHFRFWLIKKVVGKYHVMINWQINVPPEYEGIYLGNDIAGGIVYHNRIMFDKERHSRYVAEPIDYVTK